MGVALAEAAIELGHEVVIVSGPVSVNYPAAAHVVQVVTTEDMLVASIREFEHCDGVIGAAAPCDYMPRFVNSQKIAKTGAALELELVETADVVATLGERKRSDQWVVGFALETEDRRFRAIVKLERKHCDLMVSNGPQAIDSEVNDVEVLDRAGAVVCQVVGSKRIVAERILEVIDARLIRKS
jgi:phosphopantothenoylcysteine decarboxylase / phosphopantothenate---cysteine ligase